MTPPLNNEPRQRSGPQVLNSDVAEILWRVLESKNEVAAGLGRIADALGEVASAIREK